MEKSRAKAKIAKIWFVGSGLIFLGVLILTFVVGEVDFAVSLWAWFLPTVFPSLSLMVAVYSEELNSVPDRTPVLNEFVFRMTVVLSCVYLVVVVLTLLLRPFSKLSLEVVFTLSHLWLAPVQSLVGAFIGLFFVRNRRGANTIAG